MPDAAIGQHHFQPQHQFPRIAVTHRVVPAGIGGKHAADHGHALTPETEREKATGSSSGFLRGFHHNPRLGRHGHINGVEVADAVHAREGDNHRAPGSIRRRAPHHGGIAPLRHNGDPGSVAEPDRLGQFGGIGGAEQRHGAALIKAPPIRQRGREV